MKTHFHKQPFDKGTKLKLKIFRMYIREWISLFLTESPKLKSVESINIFDFFSGPGTDSEGIEGSPLIIMQEIKNYCEMLPSKKSSRPIRMVFNDRGKRKIKQLKVNAEKYACQRGCCKIEFSAFKFSEALDKHFDLIRNPGSANLVLMDQCGITDVTPEVVARLASCSRTDILFFIPSSHVKRFQHHPAFVSKIDLRDKNLEYNTIHRHVLDYFKEKLGQCKYYLAPFSIKSESNIQGVIFGSGHLAGLEKFLTVCWEFDSQTGEANYNIDGDLARDGNRSLFPEHNTFRKMDQFEIDMKDFIEHGTPDNIALYKFCLEKGFPSKQSNEILARLQKSNDISVQPVNRFAPIKKGAFYLKESESVVRFIRNKGAV